MIVRKLLHSRGWRYRLHRKGLPGTPDLIFPSLHKAVFVHGCFWHGHDCKLGQLPTSRLDFWRPKIDANRARDARKTKDLQGIGWESLAIWQCELKDLANLTKSLEAFLKGENNPPINK